MRDTQKKNSLGVLNSVECALVEKKTSKMHDPGQYSMSHIAIAYWMDERKADSFPPSPPQRFGSKLCTTNDAQTRREEHPLRIRAHVPPSCYFVARSLDPMFAACLGVEKIENWVCRALCRELDILEERSFRPTDGLLSICVPFQCWIF